MKLRAIALAFALVAAPVSVAVGVQTVAVAAAAWAPWTAYATGAVVTYNGTDYTAIQGHTSQPGWEPPNVPALWKAGSTPQPGVPGQPGTVTTSSTDTAISLSWSASSGTVTGYRVYEGSTLKTTVTGTSATVSGLGTCQTHTYTVKAYNSTGESVGRDATATTTGCNSGVPGQPGAITTSSTNTAISLSWSASSGTVTGYRVYEGSTLKTTVTG
ncbi:carbohydrate-binding protein, partial [Nonomuraea sp. NPDC050556]|uniref:carbohydrate-binding protein n=1 Tax=Nonomuraea sp. NPDC050556 TaxID=3364369 RepID=UPI0037AEE110